MHERLLAVPKLGRRFECTTIDSFSWRVIRRWRALVRAKGSVEVGETDYERVCRCAGALLADALVRRWIGRRFPIVLIDELQDSKDGQVEIVRALSESVTCLAAADDYQDLDACGDNAAVIWARQNGEVVSLTHNHRTSATGLLAAASALRNGLSVPADGNEFKVLGAYNHNVGAGLVSRNLMWWRNCDDIAVITPVHAQTSRFVRKLIVRVEQERIGNPPVGPHCIPWEVSQEDQCERFLSGLGLPANPAAEVRSADLCLPDQGGISNSLRVWLDQRRRLTGTTTFTVSEIRHQVGVIHQRSRAFRRVRSRGVRAMTVHQAKNREFDSVVVLWPYEVAGSADRQRRLLYNAITRAKRRAVVIVQNPERLKLPPFQAQEEREDE